VYDFEVDPWERSVGPKRLAEIAEECNELDRLRRIIRKHRRTIIDLERQLAQAREQSEAPASR
jgi:hypothetical protein